MFMSEDARLAYIAGLFDGEGYVGLGSGRNLLQIVVANTVKAPLQFVVDTFGGEIIETPSTGNRRIIYRWVRNGFSAAEVLEKLLPYLICKREQASLGIESVGASKLKRFEIGKQLRVMKK